ncbi:Regulator of chromosome condensation/beta-lactamase-inhibitor protein II [Cordyceps militaris CM01]|uniref:Regulator of chromosome condensation/beta-lactamase-inhibitor protein II n=1 Tax=Cordyceps militaris (strain CM01) TaxID=983644 RepID=G3J720_CORMM|nr:Regulator of chromosome condensation/beta-lactamase-inhibitor protein II [Cordyceps militaris CM01]EGX97093.1 Regulator of chromosome condensation/beta-lactamase-inhibitor protein II [Cordyceps militaris CM01]
MELYGTGCNAWGQLQFGTAVREPIDFPCFIKLAEGTKIGKPVSRLAYTIVEIDRRIHIAGYFPNPSLAQQAASAVLRGNGDSLTLVDNYPEIERIIKGGIEKDIWSFPRPIRQAVAFDTGFAVLDDLGTVSTMGDARFPAALGRKVSLESPGGKFAPVQSPQYGRMPRVLSIAACSYATAAVTEPGAVYIWGQHPPSRSKHGPFIPKLSAVPNEAKIGDFAEIQDFALGETHAIALTKRGEVYVVGNNENGQLGLPSFQVLKRWTRLEICLPQGSIVGVAAGPQTSFIIVKVSLQTPLPVETPHQPWMPVYLPVQLPQRSVESEDPTDSDCDDSDDNDSDDNEPDCDDSNDNDPDYEDPDSDDSECDMD